MPIVAGDIKYRLSGGASNSDPLLSLGGVMSTTTDAPAGIFDDVASADSAAGDIEYRCIYVLNNHGSLTLQNAKIWIEANTPSATTTIAIALAGEGLNATAETVANENTAPTGETFSSPANEGAGLSLGNIPFGQRYAVWIRRTVDAGTAAAADTFTLRVKGDTAA
jgi:hypothetical protein